MTAVVGGLVLCILGWRFMDLWAADRGQERANRERLHAVKWAAKERIGQKPTAPAHQSMPEDLQERIERWEDEFAKADEERNIRSLFGTLGDWDAVRRQLPRV